MGQYLEWSASGRIPPGKLQNTERYIAYYMFHHVIDLLTVGRRAEARRMVTQLQSVRMNKPRRIILKVLTSLPGTAGAILWKVLVRVGELLSRKWGVKTGLGV